MYYDIVFYPQEKMRGKNKLVPRLLGVTKESILRVDEKTKQVSLMLYTNFMRTAFDYGDL